MGGSTVSSTGSGKVHLKPVGSEMSERTHLFTSCELSFFRRLAFEQALLSQYLHFAQQSPFHSEILFPIQQN